MHAALITVHATAATAALLTAAVLLLPRPVPTAARRPLALAVTVATGVMALSLAAAVAVGWDDQPPVADAVFTGLVVLALVATRSAAAAVPVAERRTAAQVERLYHRGGFVLITQLTGFAAIAVLDVLPVWGLVAVAVATVLAARAVVGALQAAALRQLVAPVG